MYNSVIAGMEAGEECTRVEVGWVCSRRFLSEIRDGYRWSIRISSLAGQLSTPGGRSLVSEESTVGAGTKRTLEEEGRRGDLPMACS